MNKADTFLIDNINEILTNGSIDENPRGRYESDGAPAHSHFITNVFEKYHLDKGEFPIPTIIDTAHKSGLGEILWIYQDGSNDLSLLREKYNISWWDLWDIGDGTIGQRYGATVSRYDLTRKCLDGILKDPFGRRHIINLLQETDMRETDGLYPCAYMVTLSVRKESDSSTLKLDMLLNQRSNDYITAGYINKSQYVQLLMMFAGHLRYHGMDIEVGTFSHMVANLHLYDRHLKLAKQVQNPPSSHVFMHPTMTLKEDKDFWSYTRDDIVVSDYDYIKKEHRPEMAV